MTKNPLHRILISSVLGCLLHLPITASDSVLVKSWSENSCLDRSQVQPETYVFFQGHFENGESRSLKGKDHYEEICAKLEKSLSKRNYRRLNDDSLEPDLVIVVNWGETTVKRRSHQITHVNVSTGQRTPIYGYEVDPAYERVNAELLGTYGSIYGRTGANRRLYARNATNKERYYFILEAYDYQSVMANQQRLVWTTRFSKESKWNHFDDAMSDLCAVASNYFGKNMAGITFNDPDDSEVRIELGELEVVDRLDP